ncbi:polyprenyl synthetase family protein [Thermoactinomyces sp. AMNI-1]|uniref:Farnesyl diphosphate synthase n=2 Tax=Thermoactinomyces mirandus TaxID=2756294 RepID=A0A7W1XPI6_9BACL|nr:polyprenyl synthetase family protein [Thermoactinomyces mirandus]
MVHQALDEYMEKMDSLPSVLRESMRYSLLAGGKRLRPVLVLATVESLGGNPAKALPFACAVEMIHTYSLIHDDLPSMDNDDYRRGKLTNHKVFGEAQAILAGDALLTEAFGLLASGAKEAALPGDVALTIIEEGARCSGARGMVGGQVDDLLSENRQIGIDELESIHKRKTSDLIVFSVRIGAYLCRARPLLMDALTCFAQQLGLAFQIQDDILDVTGSQKVLGKPAGSDLKLNKATYPALLGLEESRRKLKETTDDAKKQIANIPGLSPEKLLEIADYLLSRDH